MTRRALLTAALPLLGGALPPDDDAAAIAALYREAVAAWHAGDWPRLRTLVAEECVFVGADGVAMGRAEWEARCVRVRDRSSSATDFAARIVACRIDGDRASVTARHRVRGPGEVEREEICRDTLLRASGGWVLARSEVVAPVRTAVCGGA